jgi:hypothetical protein
MTDRIEESFDHIVLDYLAGYRDRVYGETNISRFSHGWLLFKMTVIGLRKIRFR